MQVLNVLILILTLVASESAVPSRPNASEALHICPENVATVSGATPADAGDMCAGVVSAISFFALHGVHPSEPISIHITPNIPSEAGPTASGCFVEEKKRIFAVPYTKFKQNSTWFDVRIDREMYRALATHEAAHAIAACNFLVPNATIQAKEYLAYVAMFSMMPEKLRAEALRGPQTVGFKDIERLTPMLYMFDPMRFGAEAYLHFTSLKDPTATIKAILAGKELNN